MIISRGRFVIGLCFSILLIALTVGGQARDNSTDGFTIFSQKPIVEHGRNRAWDGRFTDPGAVMFYDGQFHMFRNGFYNWPDMVQIAYLTSKDGLRWTPVAKDPVLKTSDVPYAGIAALASSVLVQDDGTWVMYFYTWKNKNWPIAPGAIGRATADKPTGPWKPDTEPVLNPGSKGAWDEMQVIGPSVIHTEDGYTMYYSGQDSKGNMMIGSATSKDGIHWTKYKDTTQTDPRFAESSPVLTGTGQDTDWDGGGVYQPGVQKTADGWVMLYKGVNQKTQDLPNGYALSTDGIHWTRASQNPILTVKAIDGGHGLWFTNLVYHDNTYYLYFELGKGASTDIYVATHKGRLKG